MITKQRQGRSLKVAIFRQVFNPDKYTELTDRHWYIEKKCDCFLGEEQVVKMYTRWVR